MPSCSALHPSVRREMILARSSHLDPEQQAWVQRVNTAAATERALREAAGWGVVDCLQAERELHLRVLARVFGSEQFKAEIRTLLALNRELGLLKRSRFIIEQRTEPVRSCGRVCASTPPQRRVVSETYAFEVPGKRYTPAEAMARVASLVAQARAIGDARGIVWRPHLAS